MRKSLIIGIGVVIVFIILISAGIFILNSSKNTSGLIETSCTERGCSSNEDIYVGSINSDKYYECDCYYADRIKPENIICFGSDKDALDKGYVKSEC